MKTIKTFLIIAIMTTSYINIGAQTTKELFSDTISKEEMIKNYQPSKIWRDKQNNALIETYGEDNKEMLVGTLLTECKEMKSGKWVANWGYACPKSETKPVMCINKLWNKDTRAEDLTMMEKLRKKYGVIKDKEYPEYENVIPARWINGTYGYIKHPISYVGYWVSDEAGWFNYKNGETIARKSMKVGKSYYTHYAFHLMKRIIMTENCIKHLYPLSLQFMSYEATLLWQKYDKETRRTSFDALLYINAQGKHTIDFLSGDEPNEEERTFLGQLENLFNSKGQSVLPILYTSDGRIMSGHYLHFSLYNGICNIKDYVEDDISYMQSYKKSPHKQ